MRDPQYLALDFEDVEKLSKDVIKQPYFIVEATQGVEMEYKVLLDFDDDLLRENENKCYQLSFFSAENELNVYQCL